MDYLACHPGGSTCAVADFAAAGCNYSLVSTNPFCLHLFDQPLWRSAVPGLCVTLVQTRQVHLLPRGPCHQRVKYSKVPVIISIIHRALLIKSCHGAFVCPSHWSPRCGFFSPTLPLRAHNATVNDSNLACGQDVADVCMFLSLSVARRSHCPVRFALSQSACVLGSRFALSQSACSISTSSRWCLRYLLSVFTSAR